MKEIAPQLTNSLKEYFSDTVARAEAFPVDRYSQLFSYIAELSYLNKGVLLLFRGQRQDHKNKAGATSLYPSIYRKSVFAKSRRDNSFRILAEASSALVDEITDVDRRAAEYVLRRPLIQWTILESYGVCSTPLLALTSSLATACTLAQRGNGGERRSLYVLGLPHSSQAISINTEAEISMVRTNAACPPIAAGPAFRESVYVGTSDTAEVYGDKNELDFNRRLIAKFSIPPSPSFWDVTTGPLPEELLFPTVEHDPLRQKCQALREELLDREGMLFDFQ